MAAPGIGGPDGDECAFFQMVGSSISDDFLPVDFTKYSNIIENESVSLNSVEVLGLRTQEDD
jgi:hypothetical protein